MKSKLPPLDKSQLLKNENINYFRGIAKAKLMEDPKEAIKDFKQAIYEKEIEIKKCDSIISFYENCKDKDTVSYDVKFGKYMSKCHCNANYIKFLRARKINLNAELIMCYHYYGICSVRLRNFKEAKTVLSETIKLAQNHYKEHFSKSQTNFAQGDKEKLKYLIADSYYYRAITSKSLGLEDKKSADDIEQAKKGNPEKYGQLDNSSDLKKPEFQTEKDESFEELVKFDFSQLETESRENLEILKKFFKTFEGLVCKEVKSGGIVKSPKTKEVGTRQNFGDFMEF